MVQNSEEVCFQLENWEPLLYIEVLDKIESISNKELSILFT